MSDLGDMQLFVAVVQQGSLSAAGRKLGLAPSVVSDRLAALERRLGTQLLTRSTRRQSLTEAGQIYFDDACILVESVAEVERRVIDHAGSARGTLKITAPGPIGRRWIAPFISAFKLRYPDIQTHLTLDDRFADIVGDGFDIAIRGGPALESNLIGRRLMESRRVVVASPGYLARQGVPQTPEDLAAHVCLITNHHSQFQTEWRFGKGAAARNVKITGGLATSNAELLVTWATAGLGLAQKSLWEVAAQLESGALVTVLEQHEPDPAVFFAIHPVSKAKSRKIALFVDELAAAFRDEAF